MSSPSAERLTPKLASRLAAIALGHVRREYPSKLDHVIEGPEDLLSPKALHPIFFGSFDWHSCVHGHWLLATLLRLHPDIAEAAGIRALFDTALTPEHVAAEVAYLARTSARGFERPYGWGWLLKLQAELIGHDAPWAAILQPLADAFVARFVEHLPKADYPVRAGVHSNTAFALALAADYAVAANDPPLHEHLAAKARAWYGADEDVRPLEPSGDDFLSPTLMEAECMRRLLPREEVSAWLARYLPDLDRKEPRCLLEPARVSDPTDGKIAHLDGLNLSRSWCWRSLAPILQDSRLAEDAAERHLAASLGAVQGDYMGEHWLASFALLALTA